MEQMAHQEEKSISSQLSINYQSLDNTLSPHRPLQAVSLLKEEEVPITNVQKIVNPESMLFFFFPPHFRMLKS